MTEFSINTRTKNLKKLAEETFDLVIIGGGILGAGIARDAISRGMKVALVEKADFASGTSSRSSKLIHGGIRYLENLEFGLVFEALNEREKLYELAPHLVHPLRFLLPLYKNSRVGMFKMGLGMWLYDILALFQSGLHEKLNPKKTLQRIPWIKKADLAGSYVYSDAYMDDDRLTIETLRSAHELGAVIVNYTSAEKALFDEQGMVRGIQALDLLGGGPSFAIKAKQTLSCVGPWTDEVAPLLNPKWKKSLRPTKGIHITLSRERLPLPDAVVMAVDKENRIVFAIPRHEMVIIGTTDTDYKGDPSDVVANAEDINYLLQITNEYFPGAHLQKGDIIASYAGVRPLVDDGSKTEGKTSREHKILTTSKGVSFVMGGKYTTYRRIAEDTLIAILQRMSVEDRAQFLKNETESPLNPLCSPENYQRALTLSDSWSQSYHLSPEDTKKLALRHGMETAEILNKDSSRALSRMELELKHAIRHTMCLHLLDFYTRRYPLFLSEKNHGLEWLDILASLAQDEMDWSEEQLQKEKKAVQDFIKKELNWAVTQ